MVSGCFINPKRCANHIRGPFLTAAPGPRHITGMVAPLEHRQRIARLMPLDDVMRRIAERVHPVTPREMRAAAALGATLAQDIVVAKLHPAAPLALIDGWAVHAESTADAGPYAPAVLPQLREVAVGEALCDDSDAVAPLEAVTWRGGNGEVHVAMTPGEGVLTPGTDAGVGEVLRQTGHRLRAALRRRRHQCRVSVRPHRESSPHAPRRCRRAMSRLRAAPPRRCRRTTLRPPRPREVAAGPRVHRARRRRSIPRAPPSHRSRPAAPLDAVLRPQCPAPMWRPAQQRHAFRAALPGGRVRRSAA